MPQKLTYLWLEFYGIHEFGMSLSDVHATKGGEMIDYINCLAVFKGVAREKHRMSFDDIMSLR